MQTSQKYQITGVKQGLLNIPAQAVKQLTKSASKNE